jgi:hypothetical protein
MKPAAVRDVKHFFEHAKPVAAICHGPWMLVEAGAVQGRTVTSWPSLKTDIRNAGGTWVDEEVVVSNGVVTSRKPDDIPAFNRQMIDLFSKGAGMSGRLERKVGAESSIAKSTSGYRPGCTLRRAAVFLLKFLNHLPVGLGLWVRQIAAPR